MVEICCELIIEFLRSKIEIIHLKLNIVNRSATTFFPHRTDPSKDFRIWNSQLISYAAYENEDGTITGDPPSLEFTKLCMKLGWQPARTEYDILPLVLSANGEE